MERKIFIITSIIISIIIVVVAVGIMAGVLVNEKYKEQTNQGSQINQGSQQDNQVNQEQTQPSIPEGPVDQTPSQPNEEIPEEPAAPKYETVLEEVRATFTELFKDAIQNEIEFEQNDRNNYDALNFNQIEEIFNIYRKNDDGIVLHCNYSVNEKDENGQDVVKTYNGFLEMHTNFIDRTDETLEEIFDFSSNYRVFINIFGKTLNQELGENCEGIKSVMDKGVEERTQGCTVIERYDRFGVAEDGYPDSIYSYLVCEDEQGERFIRIVEHCIDFDKDKSDITEEMWQDFLQQGETTWIDVRISRTNATFKDSAFDWKQYVLENATEKDPEYASIVLANQT